MNKVIKLTIATVVAALATSLGVSAPAEAAPPATPRIWVCC